MRKGLRKAGDFVERLILTAILLMIIGIVVLVLTTKMGFKAIIIMDAVIILVLLLKSFIGRLMK